jgi:carboxyl-terminal processing protease
VKHATIKAPCRAPALLATCALLLSACGGGGGGGEPAPVAVCSADIQKQAVLDVMEGWYLWNDEPEQQNKYAGLNLASYSSADDLLSFLRYRPFEFDRGFSFITTVEADQSFFAEGEFLGFGFSSRFVNPPSNDDLRVIRVFEDSPADQAGIARGYRVLAIDGRSIAEINAAEGVNEALGPQEAGVSRTFRLRDLAGAEFEASVTKAVFNIDPVPDVPSRIIDVNGTPVGYINFITFISTAESQLAELFDQFRAQNVANIVIDVRYNGGGRLDTTEYFANLLAGAVANTQVFSRIRYNSARSANDSTLRFQALAQSLPVLERVVFITTGGSASASELLPNGLAPFTVVALAGEPTFGKPVGQGAFDYCNDTYRLRAVTFEIVNANDEGGYFDGLPQPGSSIADLCAAPDDLNFALGDPGEASLAAALAFIDTGACPAAPAVQKLRPGVGFHEPLPLPTDATLEQRYLEAF